MDGVRIFHMADAHLDAPFSKLPPRVADSARLSLKSAFAGAVLAAKNRGAQLFFIAGDLFDGDYLTPDTKEFVCEEIRSFPECRFFIAPGNHDCLGENSHYRHMELPENVFVFGEKSRVSIDELGVDVYGMGFKSPSERECPVLGYPPLNPDRINILVCHADLGANVSDYGPVTKQQIGQSGFDYIALGHIHKCSGVLCENGVFYAYPGCIEGRGFDETGEKGALFGTVAKGEAKLSFLPLARRKYAEIEIDLTGISERTDAIAAIRSALRSCGAETRVRAVLTGSPEQAFVIKAEGLSDPGFQNRYIEIKDMTKPALKLTDIEKENTLRGVFCRRMQSKIAELPEDSREYDVCRKALRFGLAALDGRDISGV